MSSYLVAYDLNTPGQKYEALIDCLNQYPTHWHVQKSVWIVGPANSAYEVAENLRTFLDANDHLIVQAWTEDCAWWGYSPDDTAWLRAA